MGGVSAVLWKELREQYLGGGRAAVSIGVNVVVAVAFGIGIPIFFQQILGNQRGLPSWLPLESMVFALTAFGAFLAFLVPAVTIPDAIAGERERHTLETLLAAPLSDGAILWGKMLAVYVPIGVLVLALVLPATVTGLVLFGPWALVAGAVALGTCLGGSAVTSTLVVGLGTFLSLRAPTVRKAQEWLGYSIMPVFMLPGVVTFLLTSRLAALKAVPTVGILVTFGALGLVVPAVAALFMVLSFTRFHRERLILFGKS